MTQSASGSNVEVFSIRGDGSTTVALSSYTANAFEAHAAAPASYTGIIIAATTAAQANSNFFYMKVVGFIWII